MANSAKEWRHLYERETARAQAAEALAEERRWEVVRARNALHILRTVFDSNREKLAGARSELLAVRRAAKATLRLQAEVTRLTGLLKAVSVDPRKRGTMAGLRMENGRLRKELDEKTAHGKRLEAEVAKLRSTRETLSKAVFGRNSEKTGSSRTGRRRGQRVGGSGHGRTQRLELERNTEVQNPPAADCHCPCCGKLYWENGSHDSEVIELQVRAHTRVIRRNRFLRACTCSSSPREVSAPALPRLFTNTPYGISFRVCFLFERYVCHRPVNQVAAWMCGQGLSVSAGTLASSIPRFLPLFAPLSEAVLDRQRASRVRYGDETRWRVQSFFADRGSSRAWLWVGISRDAVWFHVDASRSAEAAGKLFGKAAPGTVLVCDRFSAYKKLARVLGGTLTLAWCWVHARRDYIKCASGHPALTGWQDRWLDRFARLFRLNASRLELYDPDLDMERQSTTFKAAHRRLKRALDRFFAAAARDLEGNAGKDRRSKPLRSLLKHREGLCVFLDNPRVAMDNNLSERTLRGAVIGRKLSFGSDSSAGAAFTAMMYSVIGTLQLNSMDVQQWLRSWLAACAQNGGRPPDDLTPWLPWSMSEQRRRGLQAPG